MDEDEDELKSVAQSQSPSFLRRLAGPSAHKVGFGRDQEEINRLIAEASKGSKFYENEKRRDADWTERINKILERRDELLRESDIARVEARVDRLFSEKEAKSDLSQTIVHVDMDAFFANVELQYNPGLKDKPFAVVGLGVVTTGSYDARKFGVRAGQPEYIAKRLCPDLILVPVDYKRVAVVSAKVMNVCKQYDPNMYAAGCDEAYLNITKYLEERQTSAAECVEDLRARIFEETNLTSSAGIAPNMMLAKICSDRNKPNGQCQMPFTREAVMEFMRELPVRKVPGIGRVGERVLEAIGVKTCGDIRAARAIIWLMPRKFAVDFLFDTHLGLAPTVVKPYQREERKSVGVSRTFKAVQTKEAIFQKLEYIASLLERDLETECWAGKIVILTYKFDTFRVHTRRATFERWISKKEDLFNIGKELIKPYLPLRVRLLGLRVTDLIDLRAPTDQGIKRYFGSERGDNSPSKRRRLTPQPGRSSGIPHGPSKQRPARENLDGSVVRPIIVDEEEEEEEELVGDVGEGEDELEEEEGDMSEVEQSDGKQGTQADKNIPSFRYRSAAMATTSIVKIGNDSPNSRPTFKKPSSTRTTPGWPNLPSPPRKRSKSEQPWPNRENLKSRGHAKTTFAPDTNRAASADLCSSGDDTDSTVNVARSRETAVCPICSRELEMDNSGLNTHIDFCLSRGAIMDASAAAVSTIAVPQVRKAKDIMDKGKGASVPEPNG